MGVGKINELQITIPQQLVVMSITSETKYQFKPPSPFHVILTENSGVIYKSPFL